MSLNRAQRIIAETYQGGTYAKIEDLERVGDMVFLAIMQDMDEVDLHDASGRIRELMSQLEDIEIALDHAKDDPIEIITRAHDNGDDVSTIAARLKQAGYRIEKC